MKNAAPIINPKYHNPKNQILEDFAGLIITLKYHILEYIISALQTEKKVSV